MPHTYTKEELEERYKKLPEPLKNAMFSPEVAERMFEIGKKNGLTIEKTGFMAEETGFIILGLTPPREFVKTLSGRLETDHDTAAKIASEINHEVLFPLREALKGAHNIEIGEGELKKEEVPVKPVSAVSIPPLPSSAMPEKKYEFADLKRSSPAPAPPPKDTEKKTEPVPAKPATPEFISQKAEEKIAADETQKRQHAAAAAPIDLRTFPQPLPQESPVRAQEIPQSKNIIELRRRTEQQTTKPEEEHLFLPQAPVPLPKLPAVASETLSGLDGGNTLQQKSTSGAGHPIIIPPVPSTEKPSPLPQEMRPRNPKMQPVDLRGAPKPPAPPKYEGFDPYRELVE